MTMERRAVTLSGWAMVVVTFVLLAGGCYLAWRGLMGNDRVGAAGILIALLGGLSCHGFFTLQPNEGFAFFLGIKGPG